MYAKIDGEKCIKCDVCGEVFEEATYCLWFTEPQHKGKKGRVWHICDPEETSNWIKESQELCITQAFMKNILPEYARLNFTRIFLEGAD